MSDPLYRPLKKGETAIVPGDAYEVDVPCGAAPADPRGPRSFWFCPTSDCELRDVQVTAGFHGRRLPASPPAYRCPACRERLTFGTYLDRQLLVPAYSVDEMAPPELAKTAPPPK